MPQAVQPSVQGDRSGGYRPITIYDAPGVLLNQALEGDATLRGMGYTLFRPEMLSPSERMGVSDRLREALGGSKIAGALSDIVTNPWVWLAALTSSPALKMIRAGGGDLFAIARKLSVTLTDNPSLYKSAGLLGLDSLLGNTGPVIVASRDVADHAIQMVHEGVRPINQAVGGVLEANGLRSLDMESKWFLKRATPQQQDAVRRVNYLLHQKLDGWDTKRNIFMGFKKEGERWAEKWMEVEKLAADNLDEQIASVPGLKSLVEESQNALLQRKIKMFGLEDGSGAWKGVDEQKLMALYRGRGELRQMGGDAATHMANEFKTLVGDEVWSAMKNEEMSPEEFRKMVGMAADLDLPKAYLPRNTSDWVERAEGVGRGRGGRRDITPDPSTVRRSVVLPFHDPKQLQDMVRLTGGSKYLVETHIPGALKRYEEQAARQLSRGGVENEGFRVQKVSPIQAMQKYFEDSARTHALFIAEPSEITWKSQQRAVEAGLWEYPKVPGVKNQIGKLKLNQVWQGAEKGSAPEGGFKNFDFIRAHWAMLEDKYARNAVEKTLVPRLLGQMEDSNFSMKVLADHTNQKINKWFSGPVGEAIAKAHPAARKFVDEVLYATDPEFGVSGGKLSRSVASYLYMTHMGFNLGSVLLNGTQPMGAAAVALGVGPILRGYAKAAKEVFGYVGERASQGFKYLTDAERLDLVRKHFRHADVAGIGPNLLDEISTDLLSQGKVLEEKGIMSRLSSYTLGMFQTSEMLNRSVTAHAFEEVWSKGLAKRAAKVGHAWDSEFADGVKRFVANTQFTSDFWEKPLASITGDPSVVQGAAGRMARMMLANPLGRQFLTFPIRSFTFATYTAPRLGGEENLWKGFARTAVRGMGIGSVMYALGKNLLDTDLSRATYLASSTDILPFVGSGRFDSRESPIPLPPILDIPVSAVKALADEDADLVGTVLPRLVPGGIALSRALRSAPSVQGVPVLGGLQTRYVDWHSTNMDGTVDVKDKSGAVVLRQTPSSLILNAVGGSMLNGINPAEVDHFLVKQRSQIVQYRREYINALLNNDVGKSQAIASEYEKRFKLPLTVTRTQIQAIQNNRNLTRRERVLSTFGPTERPRYGSIEPGPRTPMNPQVQEEVRKAMARMQQVGPGAAQQTAMEPYQPY